MSNAIDIRIADPSSAHDLVSQLRILIKSGLTQNGLSGSEYGIWQQFHVIHRVAEQSLAVAFCTWSHRMTTEYLHRFASTNLTEFLAQKVHHGSVLGSTALATALVDASGRGQLPIEFQETDAGIVINGFIPWASNLYSETVVIFAARSVDGQRKVFAIQLNTPGVNFTLNQSLLALNATNSGSITFTDAVISQEHVLHHSLAEFLKVMRPRFLTLQTAFCLGVSAASLQALRNAAGASSFSIEAQEFENELNDLENRVSTLAQALSNDGNVVLPLPYLEVRLAAAQLAQKITRVEVAAVGGKAFTAGSDTARRLHESLFFSVQAPTEGALKWEISQLV